MAALRAPFEGVWNVVRFNWPFYVVALAAVAVGLLVRACTTGFWHLAAGLALLAGLLPLLASLAVSYYVYDWSGLYELGWLPAGSLPAAPATLLTFCAGFDETTALLARRLHPAQVLAFDFYDPARHTEASIRRARAAYPPYPGTQPANTRALPLPDHSADVVVAFMAAHEVRDSAERVAFFRELRRVAGPAGRLLVVEHLRDTANFLAYTIGFLHFHSHRSWLATFRGAGLLVEQELKVTPFVSAFILRADGGAA